MAQSRDAACLPLNLNGDVASLSGGLPNGWVAFGVKPQSGYSYPSSGEQLERANALTAAGLLSRDDYQVYQDGQLAPVARFQFTDKGREALRGGEAGVYGGTCLYAGKWVATGLAKPKANEANVTKTENGGTVSYMAEVQFALQDTPAWLKDPAVRAAFSRNMLEWSSSRPQKVELVKFEGKWVAKKVLATRMTTEASGERRTASKVAPADEEALLLRLTDQSNTRQRVSLKLPVRASETPAEYARSHPGSYFFAKTPDATAAVPATSAAMTRLREEQIAQNPELARMYAAQAQQTALAAARENDKFLTQRKELQETLDVLVASGAMVRTDVSTNVTPGALPAGVLYAPAPGVTVTEDGLSLGLVQVKGPLKQTVSGSMLQVTATYAPLNPAPWMTKASEHLPQLKRRLQGGTLTAQLVQGSGDTPQVIGVALN